MQTIWLIDWQTPENNHFAIAEEVSVKGENKKHPDIVLYVNGIALGVIELKRSSVGISQNLDNQKKDFIRNFFTTMQMVMAGNDSQGLRYGTIETPESHYYQWKEAPLQLGEEALASLTPISLLDEAKASAPTSLLDQHLAMLCNKATYCIYPSPPFFTYFVLFDIPTGMYENDLLLNRICLVELIIFLRI